MTDHNNIYDPARAFNDENSHFSRMNHEMVASYFAEGGVLDQSDGLPNWVDQETGELLRLTVDGEAHTGLFLSVEGRTPAPGPTENGKAVAFWNYKINLIGIDSAIQLYSDDKLKYVFAYPDGYIAAVPPRQRTGPRLVPTMRARTENGDFGLMPYVNLVFFNWLETEAGAPTLAWLRQNMRGWDAYTGQ